MMHQEYQHSLLSSTKLDDNISGLFWSDVITSDVTAAAEYAPLRFDPVGNASLYTEMGLWGLDSIGKTLAGEPVLKKFYKWFDKKATPIEKAFLAIAALTDSHTQITQIVEDAKYDLLDVHRMDFVDTDDKWYRIGNYRALRDPRNAANLLSNLVIESWLTLFEEQAKRVMEAPPVEFNTVLDWYRERSKLNHAARSFHRLRSWRRSHSLEKKRGRRILFRSYRLFMQFFDHKTAREFFNCKPIQINGHFFIWELHLRPQTLWQNTMHPSPIHVPFTLNLRDHDNNLLGGACVLFPGLPVLDQAVAIKSHVATPEDEFALIGDANIFSLTEHGMRNPTLRWFKNVHYPREPFPATYDYDVTDDYWRSDMSRRLEEGGLTLSDTIATLDGGVEVRVPRVMDRLGGDAPEIYREYVTESRGRHKHDAIFNVVRQELYKRLDQLDIRPDILSYMKNPDVNYTMLDQIRLAPRLDRFISRKEPLDA